MEKCSHENQWFDRTICACDSMHDRCSDCGETLDGCLIEDGYKKLANDPEEIAIAHRREVVRKQREALREMDKVQMALENELAIQRVRELHEPVQCTEDGECCQICDYCGTVYPCPTIKALEGEQV